jgi:hypothetical protein
VNEWSCDKSTENPQVLIPLDTKDHSTISFWDPFSLHIFTPHDREIPLSTVVPQDDLLDSERADKIMSDQLASSSRIYGEMWKEIGIYALIQFSRHEIGMNSGLLGAALLVSVIQFHFRPGKATVRGDEIGNSN